MGAPSCSSDYVGERGMVQGFSFFSAADRIAEPPAVDRQCCMRETCSYAHLRRVLSVVETVTACVTDLLKKITSVDCSATCNSDSVPWLRCGSFRPRLFVASSAASFSQGVAARARTLACVRGSVVSRHAVELVQEDQSWGACLRPSSMNASPTGCPHSIRITSRSWNGDVLRPVLPCCTVPRRG